MKVVRCAHDELHNNYHLCDRETPCSISCFSQFPTLFVCISPEDDKKEINSWPLVILKRTEDKQDFWICKFKEEEGEEVRLSIWIEDNVD